MDRKKIIYIGSILLVTVFVSVTYFSYAFFTSKNEYHGKVNMVVGTLDYKLSSSLLSNNSITLSAYEKARLNIEVESLNEINSKYELYYTTTNNNIEIGYTGEVLPTGTINAKAKKTVTVIIKNPNNTSATVTFGVQGGFTHNILALESGNSSLNQFQGEYCEIATNTVYNFDYTGDSQEFTVPCSGTYKIETWGAQGGSIYNTNKPAAYGGYGGYSNGVIDLDGSKNLFVFVGQEGVTTYSKNGIEPDVIYYAYPNGGAVESGNSSNNINYNGGGGSTHIAMENKLISELSPGSEKLLIVAGGGGGVSNWWGTIQADGGSGGGYIGGSTTINFSNINSTGGTQSSGGLGGGNQDGHNQSGEWLSGKYGIGGGKLAYDPDNVSGGGGGGYYGGGASWGGSGAGGSGYIGNTNLTNKSMYCYNCEEATNTSTDTNIFTVSTTGSSSYRDTTNCPNGYSSNPTSKCAKAGNGYARITYLSELEKEEKVPIFNVVTFDTNGGDVSIPDKVVAINSAYGKLPTPTRAGYTFRGWHGKNLLDYNALESRKSTIVGDKVYYDASDVANNVGSYFGIVTYLNNKILSKVYEGQTLGNHHWTFIGSSSFNKLQIRLNTSLSDPWVNVSKVWQDNETYTISYKLESIDLSGVKATISNLQLEVGENETNYEPYIGNVTSSTTVSLAQNHTLTAIWEQN